MARFLFLLLILFLPVQLGKHFWPEFSIVSGLLVDYLSPTIYFTDILIVLLFIFWVINCKKFSISHLPSAIYFQFKQFINDLINGKWKMDNGKLIAIFTIFIIVGILLSKSPMNGWYGLLKFLEFLFLGVFISRLDLKKLWPKVLIFFTVGILFESSLAITQFLQQSSIGGLFYFFGERSFTGLTPGIANASLDGTLILRPYGTFSHPNVLAGYLIIVMMMIFNQIQKTKKIVLLITIFVGTVALFLTMSRIAIALWVIGLSVWFLVRLREILLKNRLLLFVPVLFIWIFFWSPITNRFLQVNFSSEEFVRRIELASASINMTYDSPIIGVGIHNFLINLPMYQKTESIILYLQPVHNIYLLIASETGLFGLLFFVWFIAKTYQRIMKQNSKLILLSTVLVLGLFDHYFLTLQQGQLLTALVFGLCWNKAEQFHGKIIL